MFKKTVFASFIHATLALPFAAQALDDGFFWNSDNTDRNLDTTVEGAWRYGSAPGGTSTNSPSATDLAFISTGDVVLNAGAAFSVADFRLGYGWSGLTHFTNSGTIAVSGPTTIGFWGGKGYVTQAGGTWTTHKLEMGSSADRGATLGELNITGGEFIISNSDSDPAASIGAVSFSGYDSRLAVNIAGGAFTVNDSGTKFVQVGNVVGSTGTVNQVSGTATIGGLNIGNNGTGFYNISGGTLTLTANSNNDHNIGSVAGSYGELNASGTGEVVVNKKLVVGKNGTGVLTVADEATVTVNDGLGVASGDNSAATIKVTGGTLDIADTALKIGNGNGSTVDITVEGGTLAMGKEGSSGYVNFGYGVAQGATLNVKGGEMVVHGNNYALQVAGKTTINLDGGTLRTMKIQRGNSGDANDSITINFNGGTLKGNAKNADIITESEYITAKVLEGGAIIDTAGFNDSLGVALVSGVAEGEVDGGLTKRGAGTLYVLKMPTYTGVTRVEEGQFQFGPGGGGGIAHSTLTTPIAVTEAATWYAVTKDTHDLTAIGNWENEFKITDYTQNSRKTLDRFCVEGGSVKLYDGTFEATNLVLTTGAVLDLNGGTMTIKNLSGEGVVTNGTVVFIGGGEIKPTGAIKLPGGATLSGTLYATIDENGALAGSIAFDGAITLDGLNLVVTGEENFDKDAKLYTLVSGSSVSGSLGTVTGITAGGRWNAQKRGTSVAISYSEGFVLRIR